MHKRVCHTASRLMSARQVLQVPRALVVRAALCGELEWFSMCS